MKKVLMHAALGLLTGALATAPALADPSAKSRAAGIIVHTSTNDMARPQPITWDRLEKSALERTPRSRKALPRETPAEPAEAATEIPAERK